MSPWPVMEAAVRDRVNDADLQREALAFLEQAQDFYEAASSRVAANPLLLYYAFLNLGKALLLALGYPSSLERASARAVRAPSWEPALNSTTPSWSFRSLNKPRERVRRARRAARGSHDLRTTTRIPVPELLPQVVVGHRIWREADPVKRGAIPRACRGRDRQGDRRAGGLAPPIRGEGRPQALRDHPEDAPRAGTAGRDLPGGSGQGHRTAGRSALPRAGRRDDVHGPAQRRSDGLGDADAWPAVADRDDYARKCLPQVLHPPLRAGGGTSAPLASLWVLFFYFGSIVRYRPHLFDSVAAGRYGAFVTEFISAHGAADALPPGVRDVLTRYRAASDHLGAADRRELGSA